MCHYFFIFFYLGIDGDRWRVRDNCDMRIMVGCRYLHTGCQCNPQKSGSGDKTFLIWGLLFYPTKYNVLQWINQTIYKSCNNDHSMLKVFIYEICIHFPRKMPHIKSFIPMNVGESFLYHKAPVIHILIKHTSKSFALSSAMTLESEFTTEQATWQI